MKILRHIFPAIRKAFKKKDQIYYVMVEITTACNLKCMMCNIWRKEAKFMDVDLFKKIFEVGTIEHVNITGGEPTLHPNIFEILEVALANNREVLLNSNGFNHSRTFEVVEHAGRLGGNRFIILLSIDGMEETHDSIRGVRGSFSNVMKALEQVYALSKVFHFSIWVNSMLFDWNIDSVIELHKYLRENFKGVRHSFSIPVYSKPYYDNKDKDLKPPSIEKVKKLMKYIVTPPLLAYIDAVNGSRCFPCGFGATSAFIDVDGDVYTCPYAFDTPIGNLKESLLGSVWSQKERTEQALRLDYGLGKKCKTCPLTCDLMISAEVKPFRTATCLLKHIGCFL